MAGICRTCMQDLQKPYNLFYCYKYGKCISDILLECTTIKVDINDKLPTFMCHNCLNTLEESYKFKMMVTESDKKLHLSKPINVKIKEEVENYSDNGECMMQNIKQEDFQIPISPVKEDINCTDVDLGKSINHFVNEGDVAQDVDNGNDNLDKLNLLNGNISKKTKKNLHKEIGKKRIVCKLCNRSFSYRYYVEQHTKMHTGQTPYKCDVCEKGFVFPFMLKKHKLLHTNDKPFSCETCGKLFKNQLGLKNHSVTHDVGIERFQCNLCGKAFVQETHLKAHLKTHETEKKFICEICGIGFTHKSYLQRHIVCHSEVKNVPCELCDKRFFTKARMREHMKMRHLERTPVFCSYCNKQFNNKSVLKQHIWIHTGDKPYGCKICGKVFRSSGTRLTHMRVHTGETPFECNSCSLKFKYKQHLESHIKKAHR